ncbi:hypothetical protein Tco_1361724 [Tanacetum coccineum]
MARRSFYYSLFFPNSPLLKINSIKKQLTPPIHSSTWPQRFQVPSSMSSREIVIKACHWPVLTTRRTRVIKQTHQKGEFYTENSSKEAQKLQGVGIATLAIHCMRTRNSNFLNNSPVTILRRRNRRRDPNVVEPELRTIVEVAPMAERTMEELLQAPTEGYGEAIIIQEINADHFEIKTNLLQLVQASPFHGFERENPHTHINNFKRITSTLKFKDVPNNVIKLMMFPYSLVGAARIWYEKEPPNSILT